MYNRKEIIENFLLSALKQEGVESEELFFEYIIEMFGEGLILDLHRHMVKRFGLPMIGSKRACYISKKCVFKVPTCDAGFLDNDLEGSLISVGDKNVLLAKSRCFYVLDDIPIVAMEIVQPLEREEILEIFGEVPYWVPYIDLEQVGINGKKQLVVYDYPELF